MIDSVSSKKEGVKTREEREVPERGEVVVREVNCILMLRKVSKWIPRDCARCYLLGDCRGSSKARGAVLTLATPRFSIAGILCPTRDAQS